MDGKFSYQAEALKTGLGIELLVVTWEATSTRLDDDHQDAWRWSVTSDAQHKTCAERGVYINERCRK